MTERDFLRELRRGLGGAIIELKENPHSTNYQDMVLACCLKNISYDIQSEGTKGHYLYTAICTLDKKDEFERILIEFFQKQLVYDLFQQLADILCLYADDGSEKAQEALLDKYQSLFARLLKQKSFSVRYCERAAESSAQVRAFAEAGKELQEVRQEHSRLRIEPNVTLEGYIAKAKELDDDQYAYPRMGFAALRFSRQAASEDLLKLVAHISQEPSADRKANMLRVFRNVDFPGDIGQLVDYVSSDYERLRIAAIDALARFKEPRVHDLAIELILDGDLETGLSLLVENWTKADETLIRKQVLQTKKVSHAVQQKLRDIYTRHRSNSCGDILTHAYDNGQCTYCRFGIVEVMVKNHVLTERVLQECRYDSYLETRELAERLITNSKVTFPPQL